MFLSSALLVFAVIAPAFLFFLIQKNIARLQREIEALRHALTGAGIISDIPPPRGWKKSSPLWSTQNFPVH